MELLPLVLALVGLALLGLPLLLWAVLGDDASPHYEAFDPSRHAAPPEVAAFLRDNVAALAAEQFTQVGDLVRQKGALQMTTRVVLLQHPDGEVATIVVVSSTQGVASPMVEFTAEVAGGRVFDVNNSTSPPVFAPRAGHDVHRFPEVRDPKRLHRIFRALLRGAGRAVLPLAALSAVGLGVLGFREFQARRPLRLEGLSVPADFPGAVQALERLARVEAHPLAVRDFAGTWDTTPGLYVPVREARARSC